MTYLFRFDELSIKRAQLEQYRIEEAIHFAGDDVILGILYENTGFEPGLQSQGGSNNVVDHCLFVMNPYSDVVEGKITDLVSVYVVRTAEPPTDIGRVESMLEVFCPREFPSFLFDYSCW